MHKVLLYSETLKPEVVRQWLSRLEVLAVPNRTELAEHIVRDTDVLCVLIQLEHLEDDWRRFIDSVTRSFPLLNVGLVCDTCEAVPREDFTVIRRQDEGETLVRDLQNFAFAAAITNRRRNHRFDWPLRGQLTMDSGRSQRYRVRALSCDGAFLECESDFPAPGARGEIRIEFQDFRMVSRCEVVDARRSSSRLPSGFGVRFLGFSERGCRIIDRIVDDALVHILIDPDAEPPTPSLGTQEVLSMGPELI